MAKSKESKYPRWFAYLPILAIIIVLVAGVVYLRSSSSGTGGHPHALERSMYPYEFVTGSVSYVSNDMVYAILMAQNMSNHAYYFASANGTCADAVYVMYYNKTYTPDYNMELDKVDSQIIVWYANYTLGGDLSFCGEGGNVSYVSMPYHITPPTTSEVISPNQTNHPPALPQNHSVHTPRLTETLVLPTTTGAQWAGYRVLDGGYNASNVTGISAYWQVPNANSNLSQSANVAQWIGVSSENGDSLIQTGTETDNYGAYAWYELLPADQKVLFGVHPGDIINASIIQSQNDSWTIQIHEYPTCITLNNTPYCTSRSVENFSETFSYSFKNVYADFVIEPSMSCQPYQPVSSSVCSPNPITDFGKASFSVINVTFNDTATPLNLCGDYITEFSEIPNVSVGKPSCGSFNLTYITPSEAAKIFNSTNDTIGG